MGKGRYAQKAAVRRDREALAAEARASQTAAERADREREELAKSSEKKIAALEAEVSALRAQVVEGTSAEIVCLHAQIEKHRRHIERLEELVESEAEKAARFEIRLSRAIANEFGTSGAIVEAFMFLVAAADGASDEAEADKTIADGVARARSLNPRGQLLSGVRRPHEGGFPAWRADGVKKRHRDAVRKLLVAARKESE